MNRLVFGVLAFFALQGVGAVTLEVATDENLPPYSFSRGNVATGIDVDMLTEAAKRLQIDIKVSPLPWKRVLDSVEKGDVQLAMPLFKTPEREGFSLFSGVVHYSVTGLFVKKGKEFKYESAQDLVGKRFGYNRGFVLNNDLDRAIKERKIKGEEVNTTDQNVNKLMADHIDVFAANVVNTQYVMKDSPAKNEIVVLPNQLSEKRAAYLVVSKAANFPDKDKLVSLIAETLEKLHQDGTYDRIVKKYTN